METHTHNHQPQSPVQQTLERLHKDLAPVLDGDVATVKKFLNDQAHPGRDRKSGSFGFAGHNDPVAFRNIRIKRLN